MCRGLARIVVVLTDRHSTFAEEKAMTKGKEERGRWSNYRRGTALLAPCLSSILLPITRSGEAKTKANRWKRHSSLAGKLVQRKSKASMLKIWCSAGSSHIGMQYILLIVTSISVAGFADLSIVIVASSWSDSVPATDMSCTPFCVFCTVCRLCVLRGVGGIPRQGFDLSSASQPLVAATAQRLPQSGKAISTVFLEVADDAIENERYANKSLQTLAICLPH